MKNTIHLQPVSSSQIHAIGHDPKTNTLAIQFFRKGPAGEDGKPTKVPGSIYHYRNVNADRFTAFTGAESVGRFFGETFKCNPTDYPFEKCEDEAEESA
jgi:hypothetical protein